MLKRGAQGTRITGLVNTPKKTFSAHSPASLQSSNLRALHSGNNTNQSISCRPFMARESVAESEYSMALPAGRPKAMRETLTLRVERISLR